MLTYVNNILVTNNFVVMNIPSYVNFYNVQDAVKNPKPKPDGTLEFANIMFGTFMNVDYRNSSAKMVCFYAGKPSQHVAINNVDYRFKDDAFDLTRASDCPLNENQTGKNDWDKSNKVVGFNVEFGTQNQSIFKGFNVSQNPGLPTAESLEIINQMANQSGNRGGSTQNMSLYNLYKNRSYACQVNMMGNAMIQPTMYFNLKHVPMFSGPYMIQKVNHSITPGNFETTFEGIRQPTASLPLVENYIQSLKTSLLQTIIETNNKKKTEDAKTNLTASTKTNVIGQAKEKNDDNTKKEGTKAKNTQECPPVDIEKYNKFTPGNPSGTTATYNEVVELISSKTKDKPLSLAYSIFAKMYLNSSDSVGLKTQSNNYSGTKLMSDWGASIERYFTKKQYYCGGVGNTEPYVIFENLTQNIDFLISRFSGRVSEIKELTPSEITKFIILYGDAAIASSNVYTTMNPTNITNMETNVAKAIKMFNENTGNFTQTQQSATAPSPDPFDFVVEEVGGSFNKLTVTIKPNVGVWKMFVAEYHYYKVTSECGSSEGSGRRLDEYFSTNKETFTITRQNILDDEGCGATTDQKDLVGKYTYRIWIYANLDLPVTNVGESSRQQSSWNDYIISFEIK